MNGKSSEVLNFIKQYKRQRGVAPSYREIGQAVDLASTSNVGYHLNQLEIHNYIVRLKGVSRGILLRSEAKERGLV